MAEKAQVDLLVTNVGELLTLGGRTNIPKTGRWMQELGIVENGALAVANGKIVFAGTSQKLSRLIEAGIIGVSDKTQRVDAVGRVVMPGFVDCHTHLVFAGSREEEFFQKMQGEAYLDILKKGGGILSTVRQTQRATKKELVDVARKRLDEALKLGTTTIEIKSGYGLSRSAELKILYVIQELQRSHPVDIVPTFLGAHAFPKNESREAYVKEVLSMIGDVAKERTAEYCDVFCEEGAFSLEESRRILRQAKIHGLKIKLHAGQFNNLGGVNLGLGMGAISIDHLDYISVKDIEDMAETKTVGVLLPGVAFHTASARITAPVRYMLDSGVPLALATDFNPGSSPVLSMQMVIALACRFLKMTAEEAIVASTINAAHAINRAEETGSLEVGKKADILILDIPTYNQLPYWFGGNLVKTVIKNGKVAVQN